MAAAVQSMPLTLVHNDNEILVSVRLSVMTSDQTENVSYVSTRAPKRIPRDVRMRIITPPTNRCTMNLSCDPAASTAATQLCPVKVYTEMGGDITGAVVDVLLSFDGLAAT
jgi:hypothetical protein